MRYLKSYENFELRPGTEIINEEKAQDILYILEHFNGDDNPVFRAMKLSDKPDEIFLIDPKEFDRKSAYTTNYYTYLVDNSPLWKEYPKRTNSLICNSYSAQEDYGQEYRVVPVNKKSNWGVCDAHDFWWAFTVIRSLGFDSMNFFNAFIDSMFENELKKYDAINSTKGEFFSLLNQLEIKLKTKDNFEEYDDDQIDVITRIKYGMEEDKKSIVDVFNDWMKPDLNGFKHMNYEEMIKSTIHEPVRQRYNPVTEIWTDAKCLLIPTNFYDINNMNSLEKIQETW